MSTGFKPWGWFGSSGENRSKIMLGSSLALVRTGPQVDHDPDQSDPDPQMV